VQEYAYTIAGLDPDQAQKKADQIRDELTRHQMRMSFEGPADNDLQMGNTIVLTGTETTFDQVYYPESISRHLSREGGYGWEVEAKNHLPESEPTL